MFFSAVHEYLLNVCMGEREPPISPFSRRYSNCGFCFEFGHIRVRYRAGDVKSLRNVFIPKGRDKRNVQKSAMGVQI
ncbi:hypothetical protein Holit_00740 [Hollandina sp. SP2]